MFKRTLATKLKRLAGQYPVVCLTGPRQSGKTTLARTVFRQHQYVSLEDLDEREFARSDPRGFLSRFRFGVILDEVQRSPDLFSYIQTHVDQDDRPGRYILTGSQQFHLLHQVGQTLAGRAMSVSLLPFSLSELLSYTPLLPGAIGNAVRGRRPPPVSLDAVLVRGMYPRIHDQRLDAYEWYGSYCRTYIERDVRDVLRIGNLDAFQRFLRLCAGRSGQILNLSSLANDCGITHPTATNWLSVLEASGIVFRLRPHFANFSKRLIKSPKLYFIDTGLLCYLLRIRDESHLGTHPLRGEIFETFVLSEILKTFVHHGEEPPLYFWRDHTGHEVDCLVDSGSELLPIEIKSGKTIALDAFSGLKFWLALKGNGSQSGVLVTGGNQSYARENVLVKPWWQCS